MPASPRLVLVALALPMVLLVAWLMGRGAYGVLRNRAPLSTATLTIASTLGMSAGLALVGWFVPGVDLWSPISLGAAFGADVAVLALLSAVAWGTAEHAQPTIAEEIARGESDRLEFKSSARVNLKTGVRDDRMETVVAKTVAAFCNADGGTLVLGVDDEGRMVGLTPDLGTLRQPDVDRFELWLRDLLHVRLGANAATLPAVDFTEAPDGSPVCRVRCPAAARPVYLRSGKGQAATCELWVRVGNSTRMLGVDDAVEYVARRWPTSVSTAARWQVRDLGRRVARPQK